MKNPVFTGASVAIVTPMFEDGSVNFENLKKLIEFQIENGIDSITICGTTGEASTLDDEEHCQVIEFCVKQVNGRVPVVAGTGSNNTHHALELSLFAEKAGADAVLITTPYYNKTTQRGLINHYTFLADRLSTPIILYNVPSRTALSFTANTYFELSKHPNINGVKEASGDFSLIAQTASLCGDNLNIWSGNDDHTIPIMALGGLGVISTSANVIPGVMAEACKLFTAGETKEANGLMLRYLEVMNNLFTEVNPIPVKTALKLMGMDNGHMRLPLFPMAPDNAAKLRAALVKMGIKVVE